jgi:hypothetical protein|tara:strand:- start:2750 stop:3085 length:336 start_codon:yes stop_codon:yes gene_type:complete
MRKNDKGTFIEVFSKKAANIGATCRAIGISRQTFYNWKNDDQDFAEKIFNAQEDLLDNAESKLQEHINNDDKICTMFFLKTKGKSRGYSERQEIEHQGKNVNIEIQLEKPE